MTKHFTLLLFIGLAWGQDEYPYFKDPSKQFKFEQNRITIIEEKGQKQIISGGESYSELANAFGYIFLDENPAFISNTTEIKTHYEYYYNFQILKGAKELTELEFLSEIGLKEEANNILKKHFEKLKNYNNSLITFETAWKNYIDSETFYKKGKVKKLFGDDYPLREQVLILGFTCAAFPTLIMLLSDDAPFDLFIIPAGIFLIDYIIRSIPNGYETISYKKESKPTLVRPIKPRLEQTLESYQIKSLAESYNRRIFNEISND